MTATVTRSKQRFQLLRGMHVCKEGTFVGGDPQRNVIETEDDLLAKLGPERIRLLEPSEEPQETVQQAAERGFESGQEPSGDELPVRLENLDKMTRKRLEEIAADLGVDTTTAGNKTEVISMIRAVMD